MAKWRNGNENESLAKMKIENIEEMTSKAAKIGGKKGGVKISRRCEKRQWQSSEICGGGNNGSGAMAASAAMA